MDDTSVNIQNASLTEKSENLDNNNNKFNDLFDEWQDESKETLLTKGMYAMSQKQEIDQMKKRFWYILCGIIGIIVSILVSVLGTLMNLR